MILKVLLKNSILIKLEYDRHVVPTFNDKNIRNYMPNFLNEGQKQFTTKEANESRKVTKYVI